jgi:protein-S-isoprenylcysteine O-methyltransferase Ste14
MHLILFKIFYLVPFVIFLFFGFDMKRRAQTKHLTRPYLLLLMKFISICLAGVNFIVIYAMQSVLVLDYLSLVLCGLGAFSVTLAKKTLESAGAFSWTGYALEQPKLVTTGIYAYVRHPLYLGVYLVEVSALLLVLPRVEGWFGNHYLLVLAVAFCSMGYAMAFNAILATRESRYLMTQFPSYADYANKVRAFIPVRRS